MRLQQTPHDDHGALCSAGSRSEPRFDTETVQKVAALANRLQAKHQETMSATEIEAVGAEVGLKPEFVKDALRQLTATEERRTESGLAQRSASVPQGLWMEMLPAIVKIWWAVAWILLPIMGQSGRGEPEYVLPAIAIYIGGGMFLSHLKSVLEKRQVVAPSALSRHEAMEVFFQLQRALEGQKLPRAYLSVDVAGSTEMKRTGTDLEAEYSFSQYQRWVQQVVRATGGQLHSAAGDGLMAEFPDAASAVRAARALQDEIGRFNAQQNRLSAPFRIRCGVSAGQVAIEAGASIGSRNSPVIDLAAHLQKRAMPGDILVSGEVAPVALTELGNLSAVPDGVSGTPAFSWRGTA